ELGFTSSVKVFAGGGDNACGAIGAGIINDNDTFDIGDVYPSLVKSTDEVGTIQEPLVSELGFTSSVKVFAGGGDNACGAIGAGIINDNDT
ncbi:hypothetical protein BUE67_15640, partial [Corynebacterium diphtheriae]